MYKEDDGQISIYEFISPFGKLNEENRWVKMANMIPWQKYEEKYKKQFCTDNGAPAIKFRMAMGTLLIKQQTGRSDDEVLEEILESPYKQFLIGLHEFTTEPPFAQSSITNFRKYIPSEMIDEINNELFRCNPKILGDDDRVSKDEKGEGGDESQRDETPEGPDNTDSGSKTEDTPAEPKSSAKPENKGTLMLDATCAPADIEFPTDINLLNEAREKLEAIIDTIYPVSDYILKPRTYRKTARKEYLRYVMKKKPGYDELRKAIEGQLKYVARDLKHIDKMHERVSMAGAHALSDVLSAHQQMWLETIRMLYKQQLYMYENNTHTIQNRIVSISQPHVRPIKRDKANAKYEFGAKVSVSLVSGYAFIDRLGWESYNEESELIPAVEAYKEYNGYYPERVLADQIYRNKNNRAYCKERGIRLSGPRLGRPSAETDKVTIKQQAKDSADRSAIEGKFGEGKNNYGLDRIMARLKDSSETVISMSFLCMNINRRLRVLLRFIFFGYFQIQMRNNIATALAWISG